MRKMTYIVFLLLLPWLISAQWKSVEKSQKKRPEWVGGAARNYLIVSAEASTIEEAKEKILISLKQQIVGAVATQIESTTTISREQTTIGNDIDYMEQASSFVKSKLAHIPFISEVSLSKAKEFYWEKLYDKKTKSYKYEYHLKYMFTDFEVSNLVGQFNERESSLNTRLSAYQSALESVSSVEEIDRTINELKAFAKEFDTDDSRYPQTEQLSNNYRALYKNINIRQEGEAAGGKALIGLYLKENLISCMQKPQLLSNCASKLTSTADGDLFRISYDDTPCYEDDDNYIDIRFRLGNQVVSKRIYVQLKIDSNQDKQYEH